MTSQHGLFFPVTNDLKLHDFSDSNWGADSNDRRSIGDYYFLLGNVAISWRSKKHSLTSRSSAEAEDRALADASCEILWLKHLLSDLGVHISSPVLCYVTTSLQLISLLTIFIVLVLITLK